MTHPAGTCNLGYGTGLREEGLTYRKGGRVFFRRPLLNPSTPRRPMLDPSTSDARPLDVQWVTCNVAVYKNVGHIVFGIPLCAHHHIANSLFSRYADPDGSACRGTRRVKSPGCILSWRGSQVVHMHKHMKLASAKDDLLSPVCSWCGQAGCQVWCKEVAFGQSADSSTTSQHRLPDLHIVFMKQASTFDV